MSFHRYIFSSFRPLMGIIFLTLEDIDEVNIYTMQGLFPSPYGDYFFNRVMEFHSDDGLVCKVFPSPYGDYFFNLKGVKLMKEFSSLSGFRPLMGIIFLTVNNHELHDILKG